MATFKVIIDTDNAAFGDDPGYEIASILRNIATRVEQNMSAKLYTTVPVRDTNGNTVGKYVYTK